MINSERMMRQFLMVIGVWLMATSAHAQDAPLPERVSQAYLAYGTAMEAQDYVAASEAAETAWRAARSERIDPELVGILAENYGQLALARGQYESAYDAWRNAAEISDRLRAPAAERAARWYQASLAAFGDGDVSDARQCSLRSSRAAAQGETPVDAGLSGDIHYMAAMTSLQSGRLHTMSEHAALALEAFQAAGRPYDRVYANAHYLSGVGRFFEGDRAGSMFDFHMARAIYFAGGEAAHVPDIEIAAYWLQLARSEADEEELAAFDARIAASPFPGTEFPGLWGDIEAYSERYETDAVVNRRREPDYPYAALEADIDGIVLVRFDVTEAGRTDAIEVVAAAPGGVFDDAVRRAVRTWRYTPAMIGGEAVRREGVLTKFLFTMCDLPTVSACRRLADMEADGEEDGD